MRPALLDMYPEDLTQLMKGWGEPAFRAKQVQDWLYRKGVGDIEAMTNLPASLRERLSQIPLGAPRVRRRDVAGDQTAKFLLEYPDGETVEAVWIPSPDRKTVCISTQVGCAMGCNFCATGQAGIVRNLTAGEIVGQVWVIGQEMNERVSNLVYMGQGEPLANYENTLRSLGIFNSSWGMEIGARHIAISTCGLAPQIRRLAQEGLQVVLSISLHAPTDELRNQIMPINRRYPLAELMDAAREWNRVSGRRITFEYCLIQGFNDSPKESKALVGLLRGLGAHVNLIPLNPTPGSGQRGSPPAVVNAFAKALREGGVEATIRVERGQEILAACGQLRAQEGGGRNVPKSRGRDALRPEKRN